MQDFSTSNIHGYEIREQIGAGSFGAICRAWQPAAERDVAIKAIPLPFAALPDLPGRPPFPHFEVKKQHNPVTWTLANRYAPEFTCDQRERFFIQPACDPGQDVFPPRTPYPDTQD